MKKFEDFIKSGEVRIQDKNENLAEALINSSAKGEKHVKKQEMNKENAEYIVAECYDSLRELIEAKLVLEGYKSYSHEATILFLKKFKDFDESDISFLDDLRKIRNGIKYYGKEASINDAEKAIIFLDSMLPKLKNILKNA